MGVAALLGGHYLGDRCGTERRGWRWLRVYWWFLALFATTQVYVVFLGAGFYEFEKHLVLARLAFDFLFVTGCAVLARSAAAAMSRRVAGVSRTPDATAST